MNIPSRANKANKIACRSGSCQYEITHTSIGPVQSLRVNNDLFYYSIEWPKSEFRTCFPAEVERNIFYYKGIYILNNICNKVFGTLLFPFLKLCLIIAFSLTFFACVRISNQFDVVSYVFITIVASASIILLAPISVIMSSLYETSKELPGNLSVHVCNITERSTKKALQSQLKSCPIIRCQVGNWYHMEAKAKLTMLHTTINGLVFLMVNVET